ncbi:MAG: hypothetical protein JO130_01155 [Solirubrobacterales bacterium]|nr:hypothetical protein [Solirubrobacterales bacterium]
MAERALRWALAGRNIGKLEQLRVAMGDALHRRLIAAGMKFEVLDGG